MAKKETPGWFEATLFFFGLGATIYGILESNMVRVIGGLGIMALLIWGDKNG